MISKFFYMIRYFFWWLGNQRRRLGKRPYHLILILEGDYAQLPQVLGNPILRRFRPPKISLLQLGEQFRQVATDPSVKTVTIHIRPLGMPLSKIDVLRGYLQELQTAGKKVIAWSYRYGLSEYYLASMADEIIMLNGGEVGPLGIFREYMFLADVLDKVGVEADFVQITPYKSAGDMFSRREMSPEVREMGEWLAEATWCHITAAIAEGRGMDEALVREKLDQTPCTDLDAQTLGLIDSLMSEDDLPVYLGSETEPIKLVSWEKALGKLQRKPPRRPGKYVALMGIEGMIVDGTSQKPPLEPPLPLPFGFETRAGDLSVTQVVRQILADQQAAALVVYVDSRGGSATASEAMSAALRKVAEQKPVLIVMGPVAASGGYYVATPGQKIFAQPNTITGSIGVIYGKLALGRLFEKIWINRELIHRGEAALFYDPETPWTDEQREKIWHSIHRIYDLFLDRVANSRNMEVEAIDAIGGGRVWTGTQALENGLVDELGGVDQALKHAKEIAGLHSNAGVRLYFPDKNPLPPIAEPSAAIKYVWSGFQLLAGRSLCIMPWVERERN